MFNGMLVLVIEEDATTALDISHVIEEAGGHVVGPVRTAAEATALVDTHDIAAAVLDVNSADRDILPMALLLTKRRVSVIVYSGFGLPIGLQGYQPRISMVQKSAPLSHLIEELAAVKARMRDDDHDTPKRPVTISFETANILVSQSSRAGRLAFANENLAAVLAPVSGDEVGDGGAGGWHMEAMFGACGGPELIPPNVFTSLDEAAVWLEERLSDSALRHAPPDRQVQPNAT